MFYFSNASCDRAVPSPDGRFVALFLQRSAAPTTVTIYETSGWSEVASLGSTDVAGGRPVFTPDGRFLVNPSYSTVVYEVETWAQVRRFQDLRGPISISPDSQRVVLFSLFGSGIRIFGLEDGVEVTPPSGFSSQGWSLLGNDWIAFAASDEIRVETLTEPPELIASLPAPVVQRLAISPDGMTLGAVTDGGANGATVQLWDTQSFSSLGAWPIGSDFSAETRLAFTSNDLVLSSNYTSASAPVELWSAPEGKLVRSLNVDKGIHTPLVYTPDGNTVVGGFGFSGDIRAWQALDGSPLQTIAGSGRVVSLAFTTDGRYLVGAGDRLNVWTWPDGNLQQSIAESALEIAVSSRGVVAQRTQTEVRLRTLPDLALFQTIPQSGPMAFSPDGSLILIGADLFDVETGARIETFQLGPFVSSTFSPDGTNVVASEDRYAPYIDRFDVATGDLVAQFGRLDQSALSASLSFSPDGTRLAELSKRYTFRAPILDLRIWDGYGTLYKDYGEDLGFGNLRYSPDGKHLAAALDEEGYSVPLTKVFGVAVDPCAEGGCGP